MNEIEKLYVNAEVEPINFAELGAIDFTGTIEIGDKRYFEFTSEKQIELIKFLFKNYEGADINKSFEERLAGTVNELWVDMSEEEKQQVKGILE